MGSSLNLDNGWATGYPTSGSYLDMIFRGPLNSANDFGGMPFGHQLASLDPTRSWFQKTPGFGGGGSGGSPQNAPTPSNNVASAAQSQGSLAATTTSAGSPMLASQSPQMQYPSYSIPQVQGMSTDLLSQLAQYAQQAGKARS